MQQDVHCRDTHVQSWRIEIEISISSEELEKAETVHYKKHLAQTVGTMCRVVLTQGSWHKHVAIQEIFSSIFPQFFLGIP